MHGKPVAAESRELKQRSVLSILLQQMLLQLMDFGHGGSHLGEGWCRNLACHLRRLNVPWKGYLPGTYPVC